MATLPKSAITQIHTANSEAQHTCTPEICPEPGNYYVSCVDGPSFWLMAGPYCTHADALADVNKARDIATEIDGRAWFKGWGTVNMKSECTKAGKLNELHLI